MYSYSQNVIVLILQKLFVHLLDSNSWFVHLRRTKTHSLSFAARIGSSSRKCKSSYMCYISIVLDILKNIMNMTTN